MDRLFGLWRRWRFAVVLLVMMAVWWFVLRPEPQQQGWTRVTDGFALCAGEPGVSDATGSSGDGFSGDGRKAGCVIDGDTVIIGFGPDRRRIRLTGFDAPELEGACPEETRLAIAARTRVHDWLNRGPFEWTGAHDPPYDQYGRELRAAHRVAQDGKRETLAEVMIDSGLASPGGWGSEERDWCG